MAEADWAAGEAEVTRRVCVANHESPISATALGLMTPSLLSIRMYVVTIGDTILLNWKLSTITKGTKGASCGNQRATYVGKFGRF